MDDTRRVLTLGPDDCRNLLATARIGRVVFTDRALPAVLPVTYVLDGDAVVIRTARGSRLERAADGGLFAFEVDEVDDVARVGWSVVVTGEAEIITDEQDRQRLDAVLRAWVPGIKDVFIRIPMTIVTGRSIATVPAHRPVGASTQV